jgi:pimeloyl-ACP methyl ester carboxylesterase
VSGRLERAGCLTLVCAALSLAAPSGANAKPESLAFGACSSAQVNAHVATLQCATLAVPFDRADPAAGDLALAVQRVPASAPRTGVIVLLAGGPGQAALPAFEELLAPLAREPALRGFELVAFDQRGTGQSEELQCPAAGLSVKGGITAYFGACGTALGATRTLYTSQESVEDLDALRRALGGTPLSLFAVSYGARVAGMYAREHPQGVARMVLDSPTPLAGSDPLDSQRVRALRRVLDEGICSAAPCRLFSRNVYADLTLVVKALHSHPLRTRIYDDRGRLWPATVTEAGVLRLLFGLDLSQGARELAPAAIAAAAHGRVGPLARLTQALQAGFPGGGFASSRESPPHAAEHALSSLGEESLAGAAPAIGSTISSALFAATYCLENELPWSPDSAPGGRRAMLRRWLGRLPAGATAPFRRATVAGQSALSLCADWPATAPAPPSPVGLSAARTLILSGDDDLRASYEQDRTIAEGYSDARLLRVPDVGHSTVGSDRSGCAKAAMIGFLATGRAPASCRGSSEPQALPLPSPSLRDVPPAASSSREAGQVATAAAMTLEDLFGQPSLSGGGLRGGYWALAPGGFVLHGMVDVPDVALSGTVSVGADVTGRLKLSAHLTVRGRLAGSLRLRGLELSGRVDGAWVRARLVAL